MSACRQQHRVIASALIRDPKNAALHFLRSRIGRKRPSGMMILRGRLRLVAVIALLLALANASAFAEGLVPTPPTGKGDHCVADTEFMRRNHMTHDEASARRDRA